MRISGYVVLKKDFFHYKEGSIVGMSICGVQNEDVRVTIKKDSWDFTTTRISWKDFDEHFEIITFVEGYHYPGQVPIYEG